MNPLLILGLFLTSAMNASIMDRDNCINRSSNESSFSTFPNEVFSDVTITTVKDLILDITQLEIKMYPQPGYRNNSALVVLSPKEQSCGQPGRVRISLNEIIVTLPNERVAGLDFKPGCKYNIIFSVDKYCIVKHYSIPEQKPCQHYMSEDIFDEFPNKILNNVTINAFHKNAIRLNISFSPNEEYENDTGLIVITSKMQECNHLEEFSFSLTELDLYVPRFELPHSFLKADCEYMVDLEVGGYCVTTKYKVPDLCLGKKPQYRIVDVVKMKSDIYKVIWNHKITKRNKTHPVTYIGYRIADVPYKLFNSEMVLENQYHLNYSLLNLSNLPRHETYKLIATFVDAADCSNVWSIKFRVTEDYTFLVITLSTFLFVLILLAVTCIYVPLIRAKIITIFKILFGIAVQVPQSQSLDIKYIGTNRKEMLNNSYYSLEQQKCDEFEIFPRSKIEIYQDKSPRKGNFGVVHFGRMKFTKDDKTYTPVAIKTLKDHALDEEINALKEEVDTMKKITLSGTHENVVKLIGCCTMQKPYMLVLELVACGDLKNYLIDLRKEWSTKKNHNCFQFPDSDSSSSYISTTDHRTLSESSSNFLPSIPDTESTYLCDDSDENYLPYDLMMPKKITPALSNIELQSFALQIAKGMAFLENISIVHRDLAARNILISATKTLKISDFGMSRVGEYVHRNTGQQPIRWMAPESIEKFISTSKSDVWSFGVVLWEIGTLGAFPYDSVPNDLIVEYLLYNLKKGVRLMRPEICTDELYSLMLKCWSENPDERPSFQEIVNHLDGEKKKIYLEFRKLSPAYVFPPTNPS